MSALKDKTHLVIVGDPAQLPSIGPGRVLGDMIDSGVIPVTELKTLYRQTEGGAIARLAMAVRGGELAQVQDDSREVVIVPARGSEDGARRVVQLVTDSIPRVFGTTADQLQVVTPVHKGPAGTQALNRALKAVLNPGRGAVRGFDVGDRVVATANHLDAEPTGYANGEVGTVVSTADNSIRVVFTTGESQISGKSLGDLLHGWAITVHRAQGSEWEAVVAVMPPEAGSMLSRPLVYTALTRARTPSVGHPRGGPDAGQSGQVHRRGAPPDQTGLLCCRPPPEFRPGVRRKPWRMMCEYVRRTLVRAGNPDLEVIGRSKRRGSHVAPRWASYPTPAEANERLRLPAACVSMRTPADPLPPPCSRCAPSSPVGSWTGCCVSRTAVARCGCGASARPVCCPT